MEIIASFMYNGQPRQVKIEKETDTYIQGENLHHKPKTPFATYSKAKISDLSRELTYAHTK